MTESQIEAQVEAKFNDLDAHFQNSNMSQTEYSAKAKRIDEWARDQFASVKQFA